MPLLEVKGLRSYFYTRRGVVKAVDGVSFSVGEGRALGLVGESGCGKSITCLSILRLLPRPAGKIVGGQVLFNGKDLLALSEDEMRFYRGKHLSMILQDPMVSLNPVFTIGSQVSEGIAIHRKLTGKALVQSTIKVLQEVRIPSAETRLGAYPHQFSGGMRQRVVGAIAISCEPHLLIADEPTTSLDVTIQAQYLRLLKEIQQQFGLAIIFVTHDFGIVAKMCDQVAVMYAGKVVEIADVRELFEHPTHPYTQALLKSVPAVDERITRLYSIEGQPPLLYDLPPGCHFAPRCSLVEARCRTDYPPEREVDPGHRVSCWRAV